MKTLTLGILVGGIVVGVAGFLSPKKEYAASFSMELGELPVLNASTVKYTEPSSVESWVHCGLCKQGIITKRGDCSYCGKSPNEK